MAKVAFVSIMWHSRFVEELGVEYLTAVLRKESCHEVRIFYKFPKDNYDDFFQQIIEFNPDIVGISLSHKYTGIEPLYAGASMLKEKLPKVYLCIGGIFASTNAENIMRKIPEIDCVFLGESENVIVDFVDKIVKHQTLDNLDGLVYRCEDSTLKTIPKKNFIMDLDTIPFPARDYMKEDWFKSDSFKMVNLMGSRGCHGHCHFCNVPSMYAIYGTKHRWRRRSIINIVDEIEYLYKEHGVLIFSFNDSSFEDCMPLTDGKKRLAAFANEILKRNLKILWTCCFRAETFKNNKADIELIELMINSGLYNLLIGVEAGNKRALSSFSKCATVSDNYEAIEIFERYPVYISKGFIMFTPQSTPSLLRDNLEFAHDFVESDLHLYNKTYRAIDIIDTIELCRQNLIYPICSFIFLNPYTKLTLSAAMILRYFGKIKELKHWLIYFRTSIIIKKFGGFIYGFLHCTN